MGISVIMLAVRQAHDPELVEGLTPQQAAGTGGASRKGAQPWMVLSLPGSPAKRHKASMHAHYPAAHDVSLSNVAAG